MYVCMQDVIEKGEKQPNLTIGIIVSVIVVFFTIFLRIIFGGKKQQPVGAKFIILTYKFGAEWRSRGFTIYVYCLCVQAKREEKSASASTSAAAAESSNDQSSSGGEKEEEKEEGVAAAPARRRSGARRDN